MKLIIIVAILGIGLAGIGHWYQVQEQCTDFTLNISWDTTESGQIITDTDPEIKIGHLHGAKLVINVDTPREGTLKVSADSPDKDIEIRIGESSSIEKLPCTVRELYVLKGKNQEVSTLLINAPLRPTKYGITVCATLNGQCQICRNAYITVVSENDLTPAPTETEESDGSCLGTSFIAILVVLYTVIGKKNR
ncbi:MAG: hypothetical protein HXS52_10540 [Theionarchaea archaeon]|nr:hypothetical protein [Theionarchaea archaeon]